MGELRCFPNTWGFLYWSIVRDGAVWGRPWLWRLICLLLNLALLTSTVFLCIIFRTLVFWSIVSLYLKLLLAPCCLILFRVFAVDARPCPQCASPASSTTIAVTPATPYCAVTPILMLLHFHLFMLFLLNQNWLYARRFARGWRCYTDEHRQGSLGAYRLHEGCRRLQGDVIYTIMGEILGAELTQSHLTQNRGIKGGSAF